MIKSHLLYQLSYRGQAGRDSSEFVSRFHVAAEIFSAVLPIGGETERTK